MIRAESNIREVVANYTARLNSLNKGGQGYDSTMREVATTMRGEISRRIHSEGENANGGDIGRYSTNPIYVSVAANAGRSFGRPIGKTRKSKFETGKKKGQDHRSRYFAGGYNEYKTAIGRNRLGKVNLSLSGQMANQFSIIATSDGYGLGWSNTEMFERARHLEKKYGQVWALTPDEKIMSTAIVQNQINKIINN